MLKEKRLLFGVFFIAVIIRIVIVYLFSWDRGPHFENYTIARFILDGYGYWYRWVGMTPPQPTALLPPIYTYFLVGCLIVFDNSVRAIYIVQSFLSALGVIPAYYFGKKLGGYKSGLIAALIIGCFPEIAIEPAKLISEPLFIPCIIFALYLFVIYKPLIGRKPISKKFFILGIVLGISALIKTTASLVAFSFVISIFFYKKLKISAINAMFFITIGFFIAISPWLIRNYIVFDKPMMMASNLGYNIWRGNHPWGSGTEYLPDGRASESALDTNYLEYLEKNMPKDEIEMNDFLFKEAVRFIKNDPWMFIERTGKRVLYFLTYDPTHPLTKNVYYLGGYLFALIFGIWGAIILKRKRRFESSFLILPILFLLFYAPIVMVPRFRLIPVVILLIMSSISIKMLIMRNKYIKRFIATIFLK